MSFEVIKPILCLHPSSHFRGRNEDWPQQKKLWPAPIIYRSEQNWH